MKRSDPYARWSGGAQPYLDLPETIAVGPFAIGRYGGSTRAGADKNEDGYLVLGSPERRWEFAVIVDAHSSSESAELVLEEIGNRLPEIENILNGDLAETFSRLQAAIDAMFRDASFLERCRHISGECSCLIVCRKDRFLWWYSIGDCMLFAIHPDLTAFGQTMLNTRNFFEWVGRENTFDDEVPCYSSGIRRLRPGMNLLVMATDGFVEPDIDYVQAIQDWYPAHSLQTRIGDFLRTLHAAGTRDSTTILAWAATVD
ncbi:protein phosphatase 2C domain-containing protein [Cohnella sp. GCM10027633]|uniref:protein phosphatase 2C domain-containing protein n=1 Tax=unclassified Cohnella TaxID=2636738 RepID=UPI0036321EB0